MQRHSSRRNRLDHAVLNQRLDGAVSYDRIAGYFRSSLFEVAGEAIDVAGYVVEHLALEIDPFARKPGAEFEYIAPTVEESPFAVLKALQDRKP